MARVERGQPGVARRDTYAASLWSPFYSEAVLGDASKVRYVALTAQNRFVALQSGAHSAGTVLDFQVLMLAVALTGCQTGSGGSDSGDGSGYVTDGKDVLLDLYDADVEYSADALEDIYAELEKVVDRFEDVANRISGVLIEHL